MTSNAVDATGGGQLDAGNRVLAALCVASFLAALNFFAATPFYPEIAVDLRTSVPLLGQVTTLMILISAGLGLAIGPLADRYGYRWPLVVGVLAVAVNLVGIGLAPSFNVMLLFSIFGGLGDALVFGLPLAIAGLLYSGDAQRRAISWTLGSLSSAAIVGVPLLTLLGDATSWRTSLVTAGVFSGGTALFVATSLPPDRRRPDSEFGLRRLVRAYTPLLTHVPTLRQFLGTVLRAVTWIGMLTYLGAFLADELGLSTREIGLVYTIGGGGFALGSFAGSRVLGQAVQVRVAMLNVAVAVAVAGLLWSSGVWVAVPLLFGLAFTAAVASLGTAIILAKESPAGIGTTMVLNGSMLNLGSALGAALGGLLIGVGGYHALALGLPLFAVAAGVVTWQGHGRADRGPAVGRADSAGPTSASDPTRSLSPGPLDGRV